MKLFEKKLEYTKDYKTELVYDEKGRKHKKVTYIGAMVPFITEAKTVTRRSILTAILTVIMVFCLIISEGIEHGSAWFALVSIPLACSLFAALYLVMGVCTLPFNGKAMRRDRYYHSVVRILKSSVGIISLTSISLLADFIYRILHSDWLFLTGDIVFLILVLAVITLSVVIMLIIRSLEVDERELINL